MLSARELADAGKQLEEFRLESDKHAQSQSKILEKYHVLLTDYESLQSDLEEARMARDNYKQLVRSQDRDPFVLVLVDGDGYIFDDKFVANGAEGGSSAANMLNETIKLRLRTLGLDHCRIMVRIYANHAGLSKALASAKLCGPEKRAIAPFVANFNRSGDLYDFIDAGELKENADFKIRAVFRQFAESTQCKHIFFAACHDVGYVSELQPYMGDKDRITLIRNYAFHREFSKLNLSEEELPGIFRNAPLAGERTSKGDSLKGATPPPIETPPIATHQNTPNEKAKNVACTFYQKGNCRNGSSCKYKHVKANKAYENNDDEIFDPAALLPRELDLYPDRIALNHEQHRLDPYTPPVTHKERAEFNARTAQQKLCNHFHLFGNCSKGEQCLYDHSSINAKTLQCLQSLGRQQPCPKKGKCRSATCPLGHICQQPQCGYRGGKAYCKFPRYVHAIDLHVAERVFGIGFKKDNHAASISSSSPEPEFFLISDSDSDNEGGSHLATTA